MLSMNTLMRITVVSTAIIMAVDGDDDDEQTTVTRSDIVLAIYDDLIWPSPKFEGPLLVPFEIVPLGVL